MKKIAVLYDDIGLRQAFGGVSRYFYELIRRVGGGGFATQVSAFFTINTYFSRPPFNLPSARPGTRIISHALTQGIMHTLHLINSIHFLLRAWFGNATIIHATAPHEYSTLIRRKLFRQKLVLTIHDLIPELLDARKDIRTTREQALKHAAQIIVVSNFTRDRLIEEYPFAAGKTTVVYHGYDPVPPSKAPQIVKGKYLLFVGQRQGYKNFPWTLRALAPCLNKHPDLKLICTGSPLTQEEETSIDKLNMRNHIQQMSVDDNSLANLYAHAIAFIYPSKMEGFGIPILEAFSQACPVILSNASCFPEIAGDAALYFDPTDGESLRRSIDLLLTSQATRDKLIKSGFDRLKLFSWDRCAQETIAVYNKALQTFSE